MRADIRSWTAIVVIGICGFAVARGSSVAHFSLAMAHVDSAATRSAIAKSWGAAADVASTALQADVDYQINPSDQKATEHRRQILSALALIEPLSSSNWLSLSGLQLITDQPMDQVFDSLELSMLTGPNEGDVAAERGVFAVSLWERLPADLKNRAVLDVATMTFAGGEAVGKFRAALATQPDWVRNELRDALVASGDRPQDIEKRLGF